MVAQFTPQTEPIVVQLQSLDSESSKQQKERNRLKRMILSHLNLKVEMNAHRIGLSIGCTKNNGKSADGIVYELLEELINAGLIERKVKAIQKTEYVTYTLPSPTPQQDSQQKIVRGTFGQCRVTIDPSYREKPFTPLPVRDARAEEERRQEAAKAEAERERQKRLEDQEKKQEADKKRKAEKCRTEPKVKKEKPKEKRTARDRKHEQVLEALECLKQENRQFFLKELFKKAGVNLSYFKSDRHLDVRVDAELWNDRLAFVEKFKRIPDPLDRSHPLEVDRRIRETLLRFAKEGRSFTQEQLLESAEVNLKDFDQQIHCNLKWYGIHLEKKLKSREWQQNESI